MYLLSLVRLIITLKFDFHEVHQNQNHENAIVVNIQIRKTQINVSKFNHLFTF